MLIKTFFIPLLYIFLSVSLFALEEVAPETIEEMVQITLANGMKIVLKHTDFDSEEILIRMQAKGGFAALPLEKQAAAMIAPQIVLESNFAQIVSNMLADEDIDFDIEVMPYFRAMQGYCMPADIDEFFEAIKKIFSYQHLSKDVFNKVIQRTRNHLNNSNPYQFEEIFQRSVISFNILNFSWIHSISLRDLNQINLKTSQELFNDFFSNPADFLVVIVGNYDPKTIKSKIENYLATIPKRTSNLNLDSPNFPKAPVKSSERQIENAPDKASLARFTYFYDSPISYESMLTFKFISMYLKEKISVIIKKIYHKDLGIEVIHQFPAYPFLDKSWFIIQLRNDCSTLSNVKVLVLNEIERICKEGISKKEIDFLRHKLENEDEFWLHDNEFWLSTIMDYTTWHWDIKDNTGSYQELSKITPKQVNDLYKKVFCSPYTFIYNQPKK